MTIIEKNLKNKNFGWMFGKLSWLRSTIPYYKPEKIICFLDQTYNARKQVFKKYLTALNGEVIS
jgi:hypothetical protein